MERLSVCLVKIKKVNLFYYSAYFCYYLCSTVLFGTIHRSHCTILTNFYLYLQYF